MNPELKLMKNTFMTTSTTRLVLAPDSAIDLHLHTTYSDGQWTPEGLLVYPRLWRNTHRFDDIFG